MPVRALEPDHLEELTVFQGNAAAVYGQRNKAPIFNVAAPSITTQVNGDRTVGDDNIFIYLPRKG